MRTVRETFDTGAAMYRGLEALLVAERSVLAGPDAGAIAGANDRRGALLVDIAAWEDEARELVAGVAGASSLAAVVAALPAPERPEAEAALGRLAGAARAARHQAAVSHIVVERSLEAVVRTIDVLTGTPTGTLYGPRGGVARGARRSLVERAG
jgi:FlgN protein